MVIVRKTTRVCAERGEHNNRSLKKTVTEVSEHPVDGGLNDWQYKFNTG